MIKINNSNSYEFEPREFKEILGVFAQEVGSR